MLPPEFTLCNSILKHVKDYKYLGFHMSDDTCDNLVVQQKYRMLCCRTNSLIRKFSMCSYTVKRYLFTTYCASVYCIHLWRVCSMSILRKFKVCLNNAVRMFFGYDRFCSATAIYACEDIDNSDGMFRKAAWSFMHRLFSSKNSIIKSLVDSDIWKRSAFRALWYRPLLAY